MTILEWLNCKMDEKAKRIALQQITRRRNCRYSSTQLGFGTIKYHGSMVISHIQKSLYDRITHKCFIEHLGEKLHIEPDLLDSKINWKAYGKARKVAPLVTQTFITKWLSNTAATGVLMVNRQQRKHSSCPICDEPDEGDIMHIMICGSPLASELLRETQLQELQNMWTSSLSSLICGVIANSTAQRNMSTDIRMIQGGHFRSNRFLIAGWISLRKR